MKKIKFQVLLEDEFKKIKMQNSNYSKTAFAKKLNVSPSHLSQLLNNKKPLTHSVLAKITKVYPLDKALYDSILDEMEAFNVEKKELIKKPLETSRVQLSSYEQSLVSSWEYMAVLSLAEIDGNSSDAKWIATRLNIKEQKAGDIFKCLLKLQLIKVDSSGYSLNFGHVKTTDGVSSKDVKNYHLGAIKKALEAVDNFSVDERIASALVVAFDPDDMTKVHKSINSFKDKIGKVVKGGINLTRSYQLSIQFIPLDTGVDSVD